VEIGVPRVSVLEGGLTAWIAEGGPVASGTPARDETPPPASAS
jgi:3-mercaptopyruvate sulfurtransferase SseA